MPFPDPDFPHAPLTFTDWGCMVFIAMATVFGLIAGVVGLLS